MAFAAWSFFNSLYADHTEYNLFFSNTLATALVGILLPGLTLSTTSASSGMIEGVSHI